LPVGNDIIDLLDPESDPASLHQRYLDRVFTSEEREGLDKNRLELWSRWATKEATFKALAAERPELVFSPRAFATSLMEPTADGQRHGWVTHGGQRIPVLLQLQHHHSGSYLHAIAATAATAATAGELDHAHLLAKVTPVTNDEDPSSAVRLSAKRCLAQYLGCHERQVQIRGRHPPRFFIDEQPVPLSLSLSHHGAWVAFACCMVRASQRIEASAPSILRYS
jgi:phosphopantetheinyl transferase (holo-ACP synthase)